MPGVTSVLTMDSAEFDRWMTIEERDRRQAAQKSDDAFVTAMNKAIRRGRCKARSGTFVDATPPIQAKRIQRATSGSICGSPAAMCGEN